MAVGGECNEWFLKLADVVERGAKAVFGTTILTRATSRIER